MSHFGLNNFSAMDFRKTMLLAAAAIFIFSAASCKKDDEKTTTSLSFTGVLDFTIPAYVNPGDEIEVEPRGMSKDTVDIGYYWTVTPIRDYKDTTRYLGDPASVTGKFSFEVPDTVCTMTVTCVAFATGYYTTSAAYNVVIAKPGFDGSITEDEVAPTMSSVVDARDGKTYYYREIGDRDWFVRNLAYAGSGVSFEGCDALDDVYGRYYDWEEAQSACPEGWRLPTSDDWASLAAQAGYKGEGDGNYLGIAGNLMVNAYFNANRMWEYWPAVKITNSTGFSAIPTGYCTTSSAGVDGRDDYNYAVYWTADDKDVEGESFGLYRMIYVEKPDLMLGSNHKTGFYATVRCVQ